MATRKKHFDENALIFPASVILVYAIACGVLIPWTILLDKVLPPRYLSSHWDVSWTGFDAFECFLFASTAIFMLRKSSWAAISCTMLGTVLFIDAWFDILTSRPGRDSRVAVLEAVFIELPLALLSLALAFNVFHHVRQIEKKSS